MGIGHRLPRAKVSLKPRDLASQVKGNPLQLGGLPTKLLHAEERDHRQDGKGEESESQRDEEEKELFHVRNVRLSKG